MEPDIVVAHAGQGTAEPPPGGRGDVGRGGASLRVFPVFAPRLGGGFTGVTGEAQPKTLQTKVILARARYFSSTAFDGGHDETAAEEIGHNKITWEAGGAL